MCKVIERTSVSLADSRFACYHHSYVVVFSACAIFLVVQFLVAHSRIASPRASLNSDLQTCMYTRTTNYEISHILFLTPQTYLLRILVIVQSAGALVSELLPTYGVVLIELTIFTQLNVIKHGCRWPLRELILSQSLRIHILWLRHANNLRVLYIIPSRIHLYYYYATTSSSSAHDVGVTGTACVSAKSCDSGDILPSSDVLF